MMKKAILTIEDTEDGVKIDIVFGKRGPNKNSVAHYLAFVAMKRINEKIEEVNKGATGKLNEPKREI